MNFKKTKEISHFLSRIAERNTEAVIVTDPKIATIYQDFLSRWGWTLYLLPEGEEGKTRKAKADLEDFLLRNCYGKNTELIAFGGGSISDVAGFVASIYKRGIAFSIIPTTVTCFVDASIGGKNAINTRFGKNALGTFYDPIDCLYEPDFLLTLDTTDYLHQFSEVFKIMLCFRPDFPEVNEKSLFLAADLKRNVVMQDKHDANERNTLNFGHTFAHALELYSDFKISHGEAVWHGIYFACFLSYKLGLLDKLSFTKIEKKIENYDIGLDYSEIKAEKLYSYMLMDKKCTDNEPRFILIDGIGSVYRNDKKVCHKVEKSDVISVINSLSRSSYVCSSK